jgi:hypothetical protein
MAIRQGDVDLRLAQISAPSWNFGLAAPLKCTTPSQRSLNFTNGTTAAPALSSTPCHFHFLTRMTKYPLQHPHLVTDCLFPFYRYESLTYNSRYMASQRWWRIVRSSIIWRRVVGRILSDVSKDRSSTFFWKVANYWPKDTALPLNLTNRSPRWTDRWL